MKRVSYRYLKYFLKLLIARTIESDIANRSAQAAFYLSFALFPLLLFLFSLFGLILGSAETLRAEVFAYLERIMPIAVFDLVSRTVNEIVASSSTGKLTIGLIVTLWSASTGIDGIRSGLNAVYGLEESRPWWLTKLHSLGFTVIITIIVGSALVVAFYGWEHVQTPLENVGIPLTSPIALAIPQWILILLLMLFVVELIYNLLPNFQRPKWKWITPGSLIAIVLWLVVSSLFRLYLSYFNSYDRTYGSLGAVMILILWLYLTAFVLMIGGAINSIYYEIEVADIEGT